MFSIWGFYVRRFHVPPNTQSVQNPPGSVRHVKQFVIAAVLSIKNVVGYKPFMDIFYNQSQLVFYSCSLQGRLSRSGRFLNLIQLCWEINRRIRGSADPQKVKNVIFCSLVNVSSDSCYTGIKAGSRFQTVSGQMTNVIKEKKLEFPWHIYWS